MTRDEVSAITHGDLPFANPLDPADIEAAVAALDLPAGARVLDVGSGAGELLALVKRHHEATAIGVEPAATWAAEARERGVDEVHEEPFGQADLEPPYDLVACIASSHAIGTWEDALRRLAGLVPDGGLGLVGEGFWRRTPSPGYLEVLGGATEDELPSHDGLRAAAEAAGWAIAAEHVATDDDWARYEETLLANGEAALAERDDPDLRRWVDAARARWEHPDGKDTLGFTLLTLRRASG